VAKLVARLLATAALWVRNPDIPQNHNRAYKPRSGQHTVTRRKNTEKYNCTSSHPVSNSSVCPFVCLTPSFLSVCLYPSFLSVFLFLSTCLPASLSASQPACGPVCLVANLYCLLVYLPVCLFTCLHVYPTHS
jgi:hypothetical protein